MSEIVGLIVLVIVGCGLWLGFLYMMWVCIVDDMEGEE